MADLFSLALTNTTPLVQPVSIFGNTFDTPANMLPSAASRIFNYDISNEGYLFGFNITPNVQIQKSTSPITIATPFTTASLGGFTPTDVANALTSIGGDTFAAAGNIISTNSANYYYGELRIAPKINAVVTSTVSNVYAACDVNVNGNPQFAIPNNCGVNVTDVSYVGNVGDTINVTMDSPVTAVSWAFLIDFYPTWSSVPTNVYINAGAGAANITVPVLIPPPISGGYQIQISIT